MEWKDEGTGGVPILSWCREVDAAAREQAVHLARHPVVVGHVALMPDCHVGYGMPIGGVIACRDAVIPNAVGVDIGCGMSAVPTTVRAGEVDRATLAAILDEIRRRIPVGEGHGHATPQAWSRFAEWTNDPPPWLDTRARELMARNLGTLGGGNHFIELQESEDGLLWLMLHSGSRNLGYRIARYFHHQAQALNARQGIALPSPDLAFLPDRSPEGQAYLAAMRFALDYALENRARMMGVAREAVAAHLPEAAFGDEINIHHNYAGSEIHGGERLWVHRKGATSARAGETGIIPGSMGTPSYVVRGRGSPASFHSCSHGAGRTMGRKEASRRLDPDACTRAMDGIVFAGWQRLPPSRKRTGAATHDLGEAPQAYKDIDAVMAAQQDLVEPVVRLRPRGVIKG